MPERVKRPPLHNDPAAAAKEIVQDMKPIDAVNYLINFIEEHLGRRSRQIEWIEHIPSITATEASLLDALWSSSPRMASYKGIYDRIYAGTFDDAPEPNILKVFCTKLRRKLPTGVEIQTVWGQGYRLVVTDPPKGWPTK
ncbi:MAG: helix-turn-helix domain-containing protein [Pseudomonadota bacterium]